LFANFIGDDCKSAALFTGAGGFNRGVESQQIGLVGDVVNHTDDVPNLVGTLA
jgi:hypothetical protein